METKSKYYLRIILNAPAVARTPSGEIEQAFYACDIRAFNNLEAITIDFNVEDERELEKIDHIKAIVKHDIGLFKYVLMMHLKDAGFVVSDVKDDNQE